MDKKKLLYDLATSFIHTPYRWGGDDPTGVDCSGFIIELLKSFGLVPNAFDSTAKDLHNILLARSGSVAVPDDSFGDLVFFGGDISSISHVALCLGGGLMLEAGGGGSKTKTVDDAVAQNAFVRIRPIKNRKDVVATIHIEWGF